MATYTDNYQLTKPTYAEQADIGVINSNMNKIDDVMHSSQISLAPAYDSTQTYAEGDVVMYELLMYKCISPTTGVWDGSKWERTTASESGGGGSAELDILGEASGAVASFADGASAELAKCIAEIVPKQSGTGTPSPSNICPISGYTAVKVDVAGKNHVRTENVATSNISVTKNINGSATATGYSNGTTRLPRFGFASLKAGTYILSGISGGSNNTYGLRITDTNNQYILDLYDGEQEFTLLEDTSIYLLGRFSANQTAAFNVTFYPMIRLATESDTFEPYKGNTTTTPLGQTVYGGQLNVLTGELTITHKAVTVNDLQWYKGTSGSYARFYSENVSDIKLPSSQTSTDQTVIAEQYETLSIFNDILTTNGGIVVNATGAINITDDGYTSAADFKTAKSSMRICYELATPQTVQLTPQEVNSLLGQNNISADTGDIDIVYVKASAPIQPNPTGTPTATLKKLGIEGAVFEVEGSGGGGSSSGIHYSTTEQVIGTWIDGKPLYQKTYNISQTILETTGTVISSISVSGLKLINGLGVDQTNSQATPIAVYSENNNLKAAPPIRFMVDSITIWYTKTTDTAGSGNYNSLGVPMVHYSTNEQVIGTFEDENGIIKPLYQKMVRFTNISKNGDIPFGVVGGENYMLITGKLSSSFSFPYIHGSAPSNNIGGFFDGDKWSLRSGADAPGTVTGFMIIQYTKITD